MTTKKITDLGAGGIVTAEKFAVEVEYSNGTTAVGPERFDSYESAEMVCDELEAGLCRADRPVDIVQAYVVTADGTEV